MVIGCIFGLDFQILELLFDFLRYFPDLIWHANSYFIVLFGQIPVETLNTSHPDFFPILTLKLLLNKGVESS